jgi:alpha-beta hydrolase superfamily lysophospholipase
MPAADAMIYLAAHPGQGRVLGECIDAAVTDEDDPLAGDTALDMYHPDNGFREPPEWSVYDPGFVARYREAQRARVARIDAQARELVVAGRDAAREARAPGFDARPLAERQAVLRRKHLDRVMIVYRTMANLHYVDRRLDPSERGYGSLLSERPDLMNMTLLGFSRVVTPRAWLSTWSAISSQADMPRHVAVIAEPTLVVSAGADREIYPASHVAPVVEALAADDRTQLVVPGAGHYFEPAFGATEAPQREELGRILVEWIGERFTL